MKRIHIYITAMGPTVAFGSQGMLHKKVETAANGTRTNFICAQMEER